MATAHTVQQGECMTQIAAAYGFADYNAIYQQPDNAELRKYRPSPNVLYPGDVVQIPDLQRKSVDRSTGQSHKFQVTVPKKELRVVLLDPTHQPLASKSFELTLDGVPEPILGATTGKGLVK